MTPRLTDREFGVGGRVDTGLLWGISGRLESLWKSCGRPTAGGQGRGQAGLAASLPFCTLPFWISCILSPDTQLETVKKKHPPTPPVYVSIIHNFSGWRRSGSAPPTGWFRMQPPVNKLRLLSLRLQRFNCVPNILEFTDNDTVIDVHLCDATWDIWMQSLVSHGSFCPPPFCAWCQTGVRPSCSNFCWQAPLPPSHKTVFTGTIRSIKHSYSTE